MNDVLVDQNGDLRCPNCHGKNFNTGHTMRGKVSFGVGVLLTAKKLRCMACGAYSKGGAAKRWTDPALISRPSPSRMSPVVRATPIATPSDIDAQGLYKLLVTGFSEPVTGSTIASRLLTLTSGATLEQRRSYATRLSKGEPVVVAFCDGAAGTELLERARSLAIIAELVPR